MSAGYSVLFVRKMETADRTRIGVRLGLYCIANDIPVSKIAKDFGVSREAVYNWFTGKFTPNKKLQARITKLIGE